MNTRIHVHRDKVRDTVTPLRTIDTPTVGIIRGCEPILITRGVAYTIWTYLFIDYITTTR